MTGYYLNPGLPQPAATPDGLDAPYWQGLRNELLLVQRCRSCQKWQWGPEWICHRCHSDDVAFETLEPRGAIYSFERVWHPVHPALKEQGAYLVVLVELPHADGIRLVGNLLGDPEQPVIIGTEVIGVFEHHNDVDDPFTLLQWRLNEN
ncbi:MAG: OB-fold domain-containing protein [Gammaproteobacteria bacterium]|nr:OB-fold domain-containing protein [Gammaproteobacteria bacterium]MCZ6853153.1 OB-fold domain-containing protein [Gammaproteobacteria bacterium]